MAKLNGKDFLPYDTKNISVICTAPAGKLCTFSGKIEFIINIFVIILNLNLGDFRSNQQFGLIVLQLVFLRLDLAN